LVFNFNVVEQDGAGADDFGLRDDAVAFRNDPFEGTIEQDVNVDFG